MSELREQIEEAFQQDEEAQATEEPSQEPNVQTEADGQAEEPESQGVEHSEENDPEPDQTDVDPEARSDEPEPSGEQGSKSNKDEKAPASWTPKARETWSKLPPEARQEVMKREKEVNRVLQETSSARHAINELNQVMAPYQEGLVAAGVQNPIQEIGNMLAVESRLRQGNQTEKAGMIAQLMKSYGVDVAELDTVLSNQGFSAQSPQTNQQGLPPDIQNLINQQMAPVNQFLAQQQQQQQWQQQQEQVQATQTIEQFAQNAEFLNDVRLDMADLMDMATQRGQTMSIEDAYNKACAIHPEISQVMKQREEQQRLMGNNQQMQRKKAAASSITGLQGGAQSNDAPETLRGAIEAAWNDTQLN